MILTVEIGNKTVRFSFFGENGGAPDETLTLSSRRTDDEFAAALRSTESVRSKRVAQCAVVASVVPALTATVTEAVRRVFPEIKTLAVGHGLRTGLDIRTDYQSELGADIAANAVGAKSLVRPPFAVVDLGECAATVSFVDGEKRFQGVAIMPGLCSSARALSADCASLPEVGLSPETAAPVLGKNTTDSIAGGLINGFAAMIDGMLDRIAAEYDCGDGLCVILTGKCADAVAPRLTHSVRCEPHLAALGLYEFWRINSK